MGNFKQIGLGATCQHPELLQIAHMRLEELAKRNGPHKCWPLQLQQQELVLIVRLATPSAALICRVIIKDVAGLIAGRVARTVLYSVIKLDKRFSTHRYYPEDYNRGIVDWYVAAGTLTCCFGAFAATTRALRGYIFKVNDLFINN